MASIMQFIKEHWKKLLPLVPIAAILEWCRREWAMRGMLTLATSTRKNSYPFKGGWSYLVLSVHNRFARRLEPVTATLDFMHAQQRLPLRDGLFIYREGGVLSTETNIIVKRTISLDQNELVEILFTVYQDPSRPRFMPDWPLPENAAIFKYGHWECKVSVYEGSTKRGHETLEADLKAGEDFQFLKRRSWLRRMLGGLNDPPDVGVSSSGSGPYRPC